MATYYIDPTGGSDLNDGLSTGAPRLTCPAMASNNIYYWACGTSQSVHRSLANLDNIVIGSYVASYGTANPRLYYLAADYIFQMGSNSHDITFQDLELDTAQNAIASFNVAVFPLFTVCYNINVKNCIIHDVTARGIRLWISEQGTTSEFSNNIIYNCAFEGIFTDGLGYKWIHHNTIYDVGTDGGAGNYGGVTLGSDVPDNGGSCLVENNTITNIGGSASAGIDLAGGSGNMIARNNVITNSSGFGIATTTEDEDYATCRSYVYNNYINGAVRGIYTYHNGTNYIYNNTIVNCSSYSVSLGATVEVGNLRTSYFYNNICAGAPIRQVIIHPTEAGYITILNNNCYFGTQIWQVGASYTSLVAWQLALAADTGDVTSEVSSIVADPLLTTHILLPDSPCIRAGLTIDEVTNDIDGRKRPGRPGNKYSIGCWEYLGTNDPDHDEVCRLPYR